MVDILKNINRMVMSICIVSLFFQTVLLTACSKTAVPEIGEEQESVDEETGTVVVLDDTIPEDTEAGAAVPEDNRPDNEMETEESLLTQQEAEKLTEPLVQWAGLYMTGCLEQRDSFDEALKLQIAGITVAYGYLPEVSSDIVIAEDVEGIWYAAPEGYLYASPDKVQAAAKLLFGEAINSIPVMDDPEKTEQMCLDDGEGGMLVRAGDWGTVMPLGEIVSIENMGGNLNMVTVSYAMYDAEDETAAVEELGWIEYLIQGTAESGGPPKIIDMNIQVLFVDPEAYLYENWKDGAMEWESDAYSLRFPGDWEERVHIYQENGAYHFICSAAASENYMGVLFTIVCMQRGVEVEAPDYKVLGENTAGVYVALFPTDVQFDPDDGNAAREYTEMSHYTEEILSTFQVK